MKDFGAECRDVRFREVGVCLFSVGHHNAILTHPQIHEIHHKVRPERVELLRRDYTANGGWETFLSYEDPEKDILVGLLRLRKCSDEGTFRPELVRRRAEEGEGEGGGVSIVRELHVYGGAVPVHGRDPTKFQHQASLIDYHWRCSYSSSGFDAGVWYATHGGSRKNCQGGTWKHQDCCYFRGGNERLLPTFRV